MSGPKVSAYELEQRRQAALRAHRAAVGSARATRERRESLLVRLRAAEAVVGAIDINFPSTRFDFAASTETIQRSAAELNHGLDEAERQLDAVVARRRIDTLIAGLQADLDHQPAIEVDCTSLMEQAAAKENAERARRREERDHAIRSRAIKVIEQSGSLPPSETAAIDRIVARFETAGSEERSRLVIEMETQVDTARRRMKSQARQRRRAEELLGVLLGFENDSLAADGAQIARRIRDGSASLDPQTEQALERTIVESQARADQSYVRNALAKSLSELGYDVGDDFETLAPGQHVEMRPGDNARWAGYAVRARAGRDGAIRWHLVRQADSEHDPQQEADLETEWCEDLARGHRLMAERDGIASALREQHRPGELPVMTVNVVDVKPSAKRRRGRRETTNTRRIG